MWYHWKHGNTYYTHCYLTLVAFNCGSVTSTSNLCLARTELAIFRIWLELAILPRNQNQLMVVLGKACVLWNCNGSTNKIYRSRVASCPTGNQVISKRWRMMFQMSCITIAFLKNDARIHHCQFKVVKQFWPTTCSSCDSSGGSVNATHKSSIQLDSNRCLNQSKMISSLSTHLLGDHRFIVEVCGKVNLSFVEPR